MNTLRTIDFKDFPTDERFTQIEGKLFMADNLDSDIEHHQSSAGVEAPVQLAMTLIVICVQGSMRLKINLNEYLLEPSMTSTLLSGSFMQIINVSTDFRGVIIAIADNFMNYSEDVKMSMAMHRHTSEMPCYTLDKDKLDEVLEVYRMMRKKLSDKTFSYRQQVARAYLDILKFNGFHEFYTHTRQEVRPAARSRKDDLLKSFIAEVQENYRRERQVTFYASRLCISPKYLSSVIHDMSGKHSTQWIDEYVILAAKAMLKNSSRSIKEVCTELNFPNQSMFAKYFKQHTGMTPKEYRNKE